LKKIILTTIAVNKRTKAGKMLLELAKLLSENSKGVVIQEDNKTPYDPEFVAMIKKAETSKNRTRINPKKIWENI